MNKTILRFLTFIFLLIVFRLDAQPVISIEIIPEFGDSIHLVNCSSADFQTDAVGMNQIWDFSDLNADPIEPEYYFKFFDPVNTPHADRYSNSTLAAINADSQYIYYILEDGLLQLVGAVAEVPMFGTAFSDYTNPESEEFFPIEFEDTWTDAYEGDNVIDVFSNPFSGTVERVVDGFGTLILPSGTFENVLRTKTERTFTTTGLSNSSTLYTYTSDDYKLWLLSMEVFDDNAEFIFYQDTPEEIITATRDFAIESQIKIFPNPLEVGTELNINYGKLEIQNITLYNSIGQQIDCVINSFSDHSILQFDKNENAGFYYLKGFVGKNYFIKKIIILHTQ